MMNQSQTPGEEERKTRVWSLAWLGLILVLLIVGFSLVRPSMPDQVVILTGPNTGSYHELGLRLAADLKKQGLDCKVEVTGGSLENIQRLLKNEESRNRVALVPSILDDRSNSMAAGSLESLGSVAIEPLWLFGKSDLNLVRLMDLRGRTVATEGENTTSHQIAQRLIQECGIDGEVKLLPLPGQTASRAVKGFESGDIDAVFLSGPVGSSSVQSLMREESATLWPMDRGKAYAKRINGATLFMAPEGVFDLARNIPNKDTSLLAGATCLVSSDSLHPAIAPEILAGVSRLSQASAKWGTSERFPSSQHVPFPLSASAQRFYQDGQVGLAKVLPYRVVRFLNHLGFFVLPLLTVAVLLLKALPIGMKFFGGMKIKAGFRRLEAVEKEAAGGADPGSLLSILDEIDRDTAKMFVPRSMVQDYVDFRQFIHDMRDRIRAQVEQH